jgi:hypothetical protein
MTGLTHNTVYYVRAYATNADGTSYGEEFSFTTVAINLAAEPTTAGTLTFSQVTKNGLKLTVAGGNGAKRLVLAREGNPVDASPVDAMTYTAAGAFGLGQQVGTGNYVVFNGTGREADVTGLKSGTTYHFAVFDYNDNGTSGAENYLTTLVGRGNQATEALSAGLLFEENFAYAADSALTNNGWTAHSGTTVPVTVASSGLSYAPYGATGGLAASLTGNGEDVSRTFDKVDAGTPVYAAFLVNVASAHPAGEYFFHLGPQTMGTIFRPRVFVRSSAGGIQFGISGSGSNTTAIWTEQEYNLNTTYLLAVRYEFGATGNTARLYVNPAVSNEPATASATAAEAGSTSPTDIGTIALRQGTNFPVLTIDGLRVATSYAAVMAGGNLTGVREEILASGVRVFPNPGTTTLQVQVEEAGIGISSLRIFDTMGRPVLHRELQSISGKLDTFLSVSNLPRGHYFLLINTPKGTVKRQSVLH